MSYAYEDDVPLMRYFLFETAFLLLLHLGATLQCVLSLSTKYTCSEGTGIFSYNNINMVGVAFALLTEITSILSMTYKIGCALFKSIPLS